MTAQIHSIESFATLDGPGVRTVVFFQGCPLKCQFCHNIDCTLPTGGTTYTAQGLADKVLSYSSYWSKDSVVNGGITLSGGDAILQADFLKEFLPLMREKNVHVAMDTCLFTSENVIRDLVPFVDLWMVSMKHMDDEFHKRLTGVSNVQIQRNIDLLDSLLTGKKLRIRFLVVPGITDSEDNIVLMAQRLNMIKNFEGLEILKYSDIGKFKWMELFGSYALEGVREADNNDVERVKTIIHQSNSRVPILQA